MFIFAADQELWYMSQCPVLWDMTILWVEMIYLNLFIVIFYRLGFTDVA
jgi:hypothetical protein